ncbi:mCpol domain-containing protein [Empedobacter tilapiae]
MRKLIRLDFDNIGEKIDYYLINEEYEKAQNVTDIIKSTINETITFIKTHFSEVEIYVVGADDILFLTVDPKEEQLVSLKDFIFKKSKFTVSIGVGNNIRETLINLMEAKVSGKNIFKGL